MRGSIGGLLLRLTRDPGLHGCIGHARLAVPYAAKPAIPFSWNRCLQREMVGAVVWSVRMMWL
jgi:hypothetical protein